ncbi:MAG: hypothetical protein V4690_01835 [Patescibacteria group bacterium]
MTNDDIPKRLSLSFNATNLNDLLDPEVGATVVPICRGRRTILQKARSLTKDVDFRPVMSQTPTGVAQNFQTFSGFENGDYWTRLACYISNKLGDEFEKHNSGSLFFNSRLFFTDLSLQKYGQSKKSDEFGISPHRDQSAFVNLVVILLISGPSSFFICQDKQGNERREILAKPGDLILMRGGDFRCNLTRPYHFVGKVKDPNGRVSFSMRQVTDNPEEALKLRRTSWVFG